MIRVAERGRGELAQNVVRGQRPRLDDQGAMLEVQSAAVWRLRPHLPAGPRTGRASDRAVAGVDIPGQHQQRVGARQVPGRVRPAGLRRPSACRLRSVP